MKPKATFTVEFYGSKGWEISYEGDNLEKACKCQQNLVLDAVNCRLTIEF